MAKGVEKMKLCGIEMEDKVVEKTRELFGKTEQLLKEGRQLLRELEENKPRAGEK